MSRGAPYADIPQPMQQPSLPYVHDPALYQNPFMLSQQPPSSQPQGGNGSLPTGLIDKLTGGSSGSAGANTAGTAATDSGAFGASPYAFADYSGAYGGFGGASGESAAGVGGGLDALGGSSGGASAAGGAGGLAALAPFGYAAAIGVGANTAANHGGEPLGDGLTAGLGPSIAQMLKDPKGMALPTLLGAPFLTPFTASDEAKKTKPEWSGLFGLGF